MYPSPLVIFIGILLIASGLLFSVSFLSVLGGIWYLGLGLWYLVCLPPYNDYDGRL